MPARAPSGLGAGGLSLWRSIVADHELDAAQAAQLTEACRAKDRCDRLDLVLRGDVDTWTTLTVDAQSDGQVLELRVSNVLAQANTTANVMKQLLAALRLPDDVTGKRPQHRGPRGAQAPTVPGGKVSSLDRARAAKAGA